MHTQRPKYNDSKLLSHKVSELLYEYYDVYLKKKEEAGIHTLFFVYIFIERMICTPLRTVKRVGAKNTITGCLVVWW